MIKKIRNILTAISYLIIVITVSGLLVGFVNSNMYPNRKSIALFNYTPIIVVSGSMLPAIDVDAFIVLKYCDIEDVKVGDIITYHYNYIDITHRVIDRQVIDGEIVLSTKGDNNKKPDNIVINKNNFMGKVIYICNPAAKILKHVINPDLTVNRFKILIIWIIAIGIIWGLSEGFYFLIGLISIFNYTYSKVSNKSLDFSNHRIPKNSLDIRYCEAIENYKNKELNLINKIIFSSLIILVDNKWILKDMKKHSVI